MAILVAIVPATIQSIPAPATHPIGPKLQPVAVATCGFPSPFPNLSLLTSFNKLRLLETFFFFESFFYFGDNAFT